MYKYMYATVVNRHDVHIMSNFWCSAASKITR